MESQVLRPLLALGYRPASGVDLVSPDGREVYQVKIGGRGARDFRDAVLSLVTSFTRHPEVHRGYLLVSLSRISAHRVRAEWDAIKSVVLPELVARLRLVAVVDGTTVMAPPEDQPTPVVRRFLEFAENAHRTSGSRSSYAHEYLQTGRALGTSWKHLEVEKILVNRWLLGDGPIAVGVLSRQVGCSMPTAIRAVTQMSADELIKRGRGRSVALAEYPRDRWAELFRAQRLIYPPAEFIDPTAESGAADGILRRLNRMRLQRAGIGGIAAARRLDPSFDLNGTPRVDVLLHTPVAGKIHPGTWFHDAAAFAHRLDPALQHRSAHVRGSTVLALHHTYRHAALFQEDAQSPLPWADPIDVLAHLNDLGLTAQAGQLVRRLRKNVQP